MRIVRVNLEERAYDIHIGMDAALGEAIAGQGVSRALIVSDSNVDRLYGEAWEAKLRGRRIAASRAVVPAGEESKNLRTVEELCGKAVDAGLDRGSAIVALGGGMIGDLAGFVAGAYMRGIGLLQVPTSLLAMVDSSIGGKTGVNLAAGKNLVGVFHQPMEVVADLRTLGTLPEREYVSGLAEVVKYGVIGDAGIFDLIESSAARLLKREPGLLEEVVARCCEIKAEIVATDERESGARALLNFGHTLGHGLEKALGYGRWLHGEAVSVGMVFAAEVSIACRGLPRECGERLRRLLEAIGLPTGVAAARPELRWSDLRAAMTADKKRRGASLRWVLVERLGSAVFGCEAPDRVLAEAFARLGTT
ncbi:MAG: 3-dehydroquinate synthase [Verrucomicrobiota bacterium]|nr:3-dehydroquinate synthase [Verrucomicrobiota bacterium]